LNIISAGDMSGDFQQWENSVQEKFFHEIFRLRFANDAVFIDTSAGLTEMMIDFALRADEILVIITPEPTAVSDAYALTKILASRSANLNIKALVNMAESRIEAEEVYERFSLVLERFLNIKIHYGGFILADPHMRQAVKQQEPLLRLFPASKAGKCISSIARELAV
jgi:flagellar biosynthesis protein FlhG